MNTCGGTCPLNLDQSRSKPHERRPWIILESSCGPVRLAMPMQGKVLAFAETQETITKVSVPLLYLKKNSCSSATPDVCFSMSRQLQQQHSIKKLRQIRFVHRMLKKISCPPFSIPSILLDGVNVVIIILKLKCMQVVILVV